MAQTVTVTGLKEANRALRKLPKYAKEQIQPVMDKTAYLVANQAAARAPRGETGNLRRGFRWESKPRSVAAHVIIEGAYYWRFVEFGTVKMPARPFIRPTADALRSEHRRNVQRALDEAANLVEREARATTSGLL
jgi:HK97 gp10 family phage protein